MKKINIGILGCGNIAGAHAPGILANAELATLYAVCDLIPERAEQFQKKYGAKKSYTNYIELLEDPAVDMVCICTPSGYHAKHVLDCKTYNKHVLCEKPLDITKEKLNQIVLAYKNSSLKAGAVFQYRTYPGIQQAKKLLEENKLGRILVANAHYQQYRSPEYYKSAGWRGTWAIDGGGSTMNQGIHILDILCYLAGGATSVFAKTPTQAREIEVEDVSCAVLTFASGAVGTFQATTLANPPIDIHAEIICEKGRLAFTDPEVFLFTEEHPEGILLGEAGEGRSGANNPMDISKTGHAYLIQNLVKAIQGEEEVFVPFSKARHSVDVILSMYESYRTGKEVII